MATDMMQGVPARDNRNTADHIPPRKALDGHDAAKAWQPGAVAPGPGEAGLTWASTAAPHADKEVFGGRLVTTVSSSRPAPATTQTQFSDSPSTTILLPPGPPSRSWVITDLSALVGDRMGGTTGGTTTTSAAAVARYAGGDGSLLALLAEHCAVPAWSLVDDGHSMLLAPFVGCINSRPECCPFSPAIQTGAGTTTAFPHPQADDAAGATLSQCPPDYYSVESGGCCPSGFAPWTAAIGGEALCHTQSPAPVVFLHIDATTTLPARLVATNSAGTSVGAMTDSVFAMQYAVRSAAVAPASSSLSAGVIAAIVIGAVAGLLLIVGAAGYVFWLRRRKKAQRQSRRDVAKSPDYGRLYSLSPTAMAPNLVAAGGTGGPRRGAASARATVPPPTTASTLRGSTPVFMDMKEIKEMRIDQRSRADSSETAASSKTGTSERAGFPYQHTQQQQGTSAPYHADLPPHHAAYEAVSIKHWDQGMQFGASHQEKAGDDDRHHQQDPMKRLRIEEEEDDEAWSQVVEGKSEGGTTSLGGDGRAEEAMSPAAGDTAAKEHRPETDKEDLGHIAKLATAAPPAAGTANPITAPAATRPRPTSRPVPPVIVTARASPPRSRPAAEGVEMVQMAKPQRLSRGFAKLVYTTSPLPSPTTAGPVSPSSPFCRGFPPTREEAMLSPPLTASRSPTAYDKI